jgi:hypothetical protein
MQGLLGDLAAAKAESSQHIAHYEATLQQLKQSEHALMQQQVRARVWFGVGWGGVGWG